ncbi:DinB family protein [Paenibacillus radicis (ex Xue et al. 2023)]|uniref:DinB family protein n=1 Tax=Paenibacillus radicis (ex Xue et al. 2023) TaxID=2972489 RepID=A0ABT1YFQ8_9BACL|nr:DinB family protein [Paenibacillus radicis (ex Xue et al. 2023)]MCR8632043.1 DinB family protein [Paenibacillus radicis (ex Xue et al. 2023)]
MLQHPHKMYDYHVWANDRLFAHLDQLPKDAFHAEVTSVFPSVSQTFGHLYLFEQLFMTVLAEVPNEDIFPKIPGWTEEAQGKTVDEMRQLFAGVAEHFRDLLRRTPDPDKTMTIQHPLYGRIDTHFSEILRHIVNHGTYHRGNVTAMLRQQGYFGVPTDYMFYLVERQEGQR